MILRAINPESEVGVGGTGDSPVLSGHWPDGREQSLTCLRSHKKSRALFSFRAAGRRAEQASRLCYPVRFDAATLEFRPN